MAVGGVDTYYDYDERQWKFRRLGGGPVHQVVVCPVAEQSPEPDTREPSVAGAHASPERADS
jgi:hypothetical protein